MVSPRRQRHLKSEYGVDQEWYDTKLKEQGHCCAICGTKEPKHYGWFHIDHDHNTGRLRGLLCGNCHQALGQFKESKQIIANAIGYLLEHGHWE